MCTLFLKPAARGGGGGGGETCPLHRLVPQLEHFPLIILLNLVCSIYCVVLEGFNITYLPGNPEQMKDLKIED